MANWPDDSESSISIADPRFLFRLFQTDKIGCEVDWENERFIFYPIDERTDQ